MASIEKLIRLHKSLMTVSHGQGFIEFPRITKLKRIVKACAKQLNVSRVSVWKLDNHRGCITCEVLYILDEDRYYFGVELFEKDFPAYFRAIRESRLINADNAITDDRTCEFSEPYLIPNAICSMLDAPIFSEGELRGVVCLEQIDQQRSWDMAEMSYVASLADNISMINEHELWLKDREQLEFLEQFDGLTGLEKRNNFQKRLDYDLQDSPDPDRSRALILLGIDFFGAVNETHGHKVADQLLVELSRQLSSISLTHHYRLSRIGGDSFAIWIPNLRGSEELQQLLQELQYVAEKEFICLDSPPISVNFSTGVVIYPSEGDLPFDPLRCAEIAMQRTKDQSRGGVQYFSTEWMVELEGKRTLENELVDALKNQELTAFYQPILCPDERKVVGLEALVRWQHPTKGLVSPADFLPAAKKLGLMGRIGSFMLQRASQDISQLQKMGGDVQWVSVNIASEQLYDPMLAKEIEQVLSEHNLPSSAIELEIVEELISQDSTLVRAQLNAMSELGVRLAIDDFGTGYSSLSRLKHMPVTKLKIDKSFVDGLPSSENDRCIAQSIIGLAKGLQIELVAEGVEEKAQVDFLKDLGCEYFQGYYFAKPLPIQEVHKYLGL
ncbi:sensor domain-containing phosphodiesterase [Neptuniibacter caesariensis]|uniref:Diguanylate cyclase/phosphodiesterase (GGDEF & EALdomains) with PAS/PAC sensor n=1 Tax=Neptuniibacter caesariensis TaxID=207954 RepID=A0A7U8C8T3_NEPCE|nr:sensor domain-containing phosphodiesterase [Neptuniibacter caesariensis]EAR61894.1 Putative diguanylate cyclase/phosphodiesterase (GGDEF & EALdomains) with PAS/PAC sensor [Oceanospirillum sp. MED92] [Neptuniibacter caesariensis]